MKTGIIIEADVTNKGLNNFSINRTFIHGEDWECNESDNELSLNDADKYIELMVEGIVTVMMVLHDKGLKDSAKSLRDVIAKLEESFIQPANTSVSNPSMKDGYRTTGEIKK